MPQFSHAPFLRNNEDWHTALHEDVVKLHGNKFLTMVREPRAHKLSYWRDKVLNEGNTHKKRLLFQSYARDFKLALDAMSGIQTGYFVGKRPLQKVTMADLQQAKRRLRENFVFVGLTHRWAESMCLLHARFGLGACTRCEFLERNSWSGNVQSGRAKVIDRPDTAEMALLDAHHDPLDGELLKEAERLFDEQLVRYGVTKGWCMNCSCAEDSLRPGTW